MAGDGLFFKAIATVHPRYHTPHVAILLASALGIAFVLTRSFEQLTDTFVLTIWPFYALAVAAIYPLRRRRQDLARPYRVIGYPVVPLIFLASAVYLIVNAVVADPFWTTIVFGLVLAGIPVYLVAFRDRAPSRSA
jgi:amino acid transporter